MSTFVHGSERAEKVKAIFSTFDKNDDGAVSAEEFEKMRRPGGKIHSGGSLN